MKEEVVVFGRGAYWQVKKETIFKNYDVVAFLDNNAVKGAQDDGVPVVVPSAVKQFRSQKILVMASRKYFMEMAYQLAESHVEPERIIFGVNLFPCFDKGEELIHSLHGQIEFTGTEAVLRCDEGEYYFRDALGYQKVVRKLMEGRDVFKDFFSRLPVFPLSRNFGLERGQAIDRYYIESFLEANRDCIHGKVLEIADTAYISRFGSNVNNMYALHVANWGGTGDHIQGNLETGEGIPNNYFDCMICTQTIQMIYDIHAVVRNIYRLLKPGGTALITAHGISQISKNDYDNWGEYWRFTKLSMERLLEEAFPRTNIEVETWGNVKTAIGFLYGLCQDDLTEEDYAYNDEQYPLIITAKCSK